MLAGIVGYYAAQKLATWVMFPLFPTDYSDLLGWKDLAYITGIYGIMGIVIGALLGAVSGWSGRAAASGAAT